MTRNPPFLWPAAGAARKMTFLTLSEQILTQKQRKTNDFHEFEDFRMGGKLFSSSRLGGGKIGGGTFFEPEIGGGG